MAEFCAQCSEEIFGEDYEDFAGLGENVGVICEGCGHILVNLQGQRVYPPEKPKRPTPKEVSDA